jgi:hypothetical protein
VNEEKKKKDSMISCPKQLQEYDVLRAYISEVHFFNEELMKNVKSQAYVYLDCCLPHAFIMREDYKERDVKS